MAETFPLPDAYHSWRWRNIGPFRGGRVSAVAGDPSRPLVFYFGACAGGVFKTEDAGITWRNISDGFFESASVGDICVAPSDPDVVYVAMGEAHIRGNVVAGDGVYKSTDGGRTWVHLGLADTRHIGRIRVHPTNPDIVYVAALGHAFGPNRERGVFRSVDGGRHWDRVLYRDEDTGAIDLALDPRHPQRLVASLWQARRYPYKLESGGEGSGLFRSDDGGDTWTEITRFPGLPEGVWGKVGVAISPADPARWWALIEAQQGGLYRSDDYGDHWTLINDSYDLRARSFYYNHVFADPKDADTVYVLNFNMWKSTDGGRHFENVPTPHGDNHALWLDPENPDRLIEGNDGGACVSLNGGRTWSSIYNQPTGQFYHVTTDRAFPYRVYGAQQDNWTLSVPSRSDLAGIGWREIYEVGGAESGYIAVNQEDPNIVYAGSSGGGEGGRITRYDHRTKQRRDVTAWPQKTAGLAAKDYTYRFQWTSPIALSPHDQRTVYSCANVVFRSRDEGHSWTVISPDLTRNDPEKQGPSGGPITPDHTGVEVYCTIFAFAESPLEPGLLWAGSDDGLIHVSRDGGATWTNVTPPTDVLPEWALISIIEPSRHHAGTVYVAATRYKWDDNTPYLLKSEDFGSTWTRIVDGIRGDDFTRVIREDPVRPGLLYAGTESGVYVSWDDGGHWHRVQLNLPVVPIHDLAVCDDDLIAATHGRGFWILDDLTGWRAGPDVGALAVLPSKPAVRFRPSGRFLAPRDLAVNHPTVVLEAPAGDSYYLLAKGERGEAPVFADRGQNPPLGAVLHFVLPPGVAGPVTITVRDAEGAVVRTFSSTDEEEDRRLPSTPGPHRWVWNLRHPGPARLQGAEGPMGEMDGALVVPGRYRVELTAGDATATAELTVVSDPRTGATDVDLAAQKDFVQQAVTLLDKLRVAVRRSRAARANADNWVSRATGLPGQDAVREQADKLKARLSGIEEQLARPVPPKGMRPMAMGPRLEDQVLHLRLVADTADFPPTVAIRRLFDETAGQVEALVAELNQAVDEERAAFEQVLREQHMPVV
jgi:photosystem II stability/assembly factor-like uncharacterized protein